MDWYDTFRNTKVNYYLIPFSFAVGPLLYLYVKSVTTSGFRFRKTDFWHFIPQIIYTIYRLALFGYDSMQPGFSDTQNGIMLEQLDYQYVDPFYMLFSKLQLLLYLAFTVQLFYRYRHKIHQFYSNTFKLELNWLRNFLAIYVLLFIYEVLEIIINESIMELHWTQKWWYHFIAALAIIYIGIKGYFTQTDTLKDLEFNNVKGPSYPKDIDELETDFDDEKAKIQAYVETNRSFLDPDLSLKSLAKQLNYSPTQLSEIINNGFGVNFNDFINSFRVDAVKKLLKEGKHKELTLMGIAYDSGFNSKATFNRVFKKIAGVSPTEFLKSI